MRDRERGVPRYNEFRRLLHMKPSTTFEELTDDPEHGREPRRRLRRRRRVDLMVGMYAEPLPQGFGFSDTAFRVFILMASRRLKSDRFFTRDYRPEIYTPAGLAWVDDNTMARAAAALPGARAGARGVENAFAPWQRAGAPGAS